MFGVFHVKNHDFTQKNYIFSNLKGGAPPSGSAPDSVRNNMEYDKAGNQRP